MSYNERTQTFDDISTVSIAVGDSEWSRRIVVERMIGGYVLARNNDGKYVSQPGSARSYTSKLENARIYPTREQAERDSCGNETVRSIADCFGGLRR